MKASVFAATFAAVASCTLATLPASAASLVGGAGFDAQGTLDDPGGGAAPGTVTLSGIGDFADDFGFGIFDGFTIESVGDLTLTLDAETGLFSNASIEDWKVYKNESGDTIIFDLAAGSAWTRTTSAFGGVSYVNVGGPIGGYQGTYTTASGETRPGSGFVNFSVSAFSPEIAEIEVTQEAAVPEPTTMLGLAIAGLGAGIARRKMKQAQA